MSHIKSLINNLINDRSAEAELDLHNHILSVVRGSLHEAVAGDQMYKLQWPKMKFGVRKGQTLVVPFRWFSSDGGFDRQDRAQIKALKVGDKLELGEDTQLITIERVADDTPESPNAW